MLNKQAVINGGLSLVSITQCLPGPRCPQRRVKWHAENYPDEDGKRGTGVKITGEQGKALSLRWLEELRVKLHWKVIVEKYIRKCEKYTKGS